MEGSKRTPAPVAEGVEERPSLPSLPPVPHQSPPLPPPGEEAATLSPLKVYGSVGSILGGPLPTTEEEAAALPPLKV